MRGALPIGTVLEGFRIDSVLSDAGNFAIVYQAYDTDAARVAKRSEKIKGRLHRWRDRYGPSAARTPLDPGPIVVIKEYAPRQLSQREDLNLWPAPDKIDQFNWGKQRFLHEGRFLSEHSHPNVVAIYNRFEAFNTAYYVMEHLTGGSLSSDVKRSGVHNEARVRSWLEPVLEGLASVERRNANHLDLSPGNIMFRRPGGDPVLVDFGAARIETSSVRPARSYTVVDENYAAPEKFTKTSRHLDSRSDVYSLGALIHFAMNGRPPPSHATRSAGGSNAEATLPTSASGDFAQAVARAFSLQATMRFDSSAAFSAAITRARAPDPHGGTIVGRPVTVATASAGRDNTTLLIILLSAAAMLVVIIAAVLIAQLS